ncbi:MAG: SOS response-associated peptidase [Acetobacteraceae bacterium]
MCGRYASSLASAAIARLFHTVNPLPNAAPSWNIAPSQTPLIVRRDPASGARHLVKMRWGLMPIWIKEPRRAQINARAETVATAPFFRAAFAGRRCLVPAEAFYEWGQGAGGKVAYAIARRDGEPMALGGIWEPPRRDGEGSGEATEATFAIITTEANATLGAIHGRMPVILGDADWPLWLGDIKGDDAKALLRPAADDLLRAWPVGRRVNSPANDGPDLLDAMGEAGSPA